MVLLRIVIIFWGVGFVLVYTLRGLIHAVRALTVVLIQMLTEMVNGRRKVWHAPALFIKSSTPGSKWVQ